MADINHLASYIKIKEDTQAAAYGFYDAFFLLEIEKWAITEEQALNNTDLLKSAIQVNVSKFQEIIRQSWEPYIYHLLAVLGWVTNSENPSFLEALIAVNHDIIEDTDVDFNTLKKIFWVESAFGVHLISKKPFYAFIDPKHDPVHDLQTMGFIKSVDILNDKYLVNDVFKKDYKDLLKLVRWSIYWEDTEINLDYIIANYNTLISDEKIWGFMNKKNINCPKLRALAKFKSIEKKYKTPKNKAFFSHMESLDW